MDEATQSYMKLHEATASYGKLDEAAAKLKERK